MEKREQNVPLRVAPALGSLIESEVEVEVGVLLGKGLELSAQENVFFSLVGKEQRHAHLLGVGLFENGCDDLQHGRDAGSARNETNVLRTHCALALAGSSNDALALARVCQLALRSLHVDGVVNPHRF